MREIMETKELYQAPEFEVEVYETEDVVTVSGFGDNDISNPWSIIISSR